MEPTISPNESVFEQGVTKIAQSADHDAAYWLNKVGPEYAGALLTWARAFEQAIQFRVRARIAEIERQARAEQIERWESAALTRALSPDSARREAPRKPQTQVVTAATLEELL